MARETREMTRKKETDLSHFRVFSRVSRANLFPGKGDLAVASSWHGDREVAAPWGFVGVPWRAGVTWGRRANFPDVPPVRPFSALQSEGLERYLAEVRALPPLTEAETDGIFAAALRGDPAAQVDFLPIAPGNSLSPPPPWDSLFPGFLFSRRS